MEKQVIEINGIKMEVDLRYAKRLDTFKVGTKVKVLIKNDYSGQDVKPGVVVGFEPFESLPTIIVAYVAVTYSEAKLEFAYINSSDASRKKYEVIASVDDELPLDKKEVVSGFDREIAKKKAEISDIELKKDFFLKHFNQYFVAETA